MTIQVLTQVAFICGSGAFLVGSCLSLFTLLNGA